MTLQEWISVGSFIIAILAALKAFRFLPFEKRKTIAETTKMFEEAARSATLRAEQEANRAEQEANRAQAYADKNEALEKKVDRMECEIKGLRDWAKRLCAQVKELGGVPVPFKAE